MVEKTHLARATGVYLCGRDPAAHPELPPAPPSEDPTCLGCLRALTFVSAGAAALALAPQTEAPLNPEWLSELVPGIPEDSIPEEIVTWADGVTEAYNEETDELLWETDWEWYGGQSIFRDTPEGPRAFKIPKKLRVRYGIGKYGLRGNNGDRA